jgi:hypothetical protein
MRSALIVTQKEKYRKGLRELEDKLDSLLMP